MESTDQLQSLVGKKLRDLRVERGLSQRELARRAEMTNANLSMIEQGRVSPSIHTLEKILRAVPISLTDFFRDDMASTFCVSKRSAQPRLLQTGTESYLCLVSNTEGSPYLVHQCIEPGVVVTEMPIGPPDSWLSVMVMQGILTVTLGDQSETLEPGDAMQLHLLRKFRLENRTHQLLMLVLVISPTPQHIDKKV